MPFLSFKSPISPESRPVRPDLRRSRLVRFEPDLIINGVTEPLFAAQVSLCRLHRDMSKEKLYLHQLTAGLMTETGTRSGEHAACGMFAGMPNSGLCRIAGQVVFLGLNGPRPQLAAIRHNNADYSFFNWPTGYRQGGNGASWPRWVRIC